MRPTKYPLIGALAATVALSACATSSTSGDAPTAANAAAANAAAANAAAGNTPSPPAGGALRDLTPEEKKAIMEAVAPSLRNPASAKYRWTKFSTAPAADGSFNYCAAVDAQSPYAAYNGHQVYIVEIKLTSGKVTAAVMGLITGGKDAAIVSGMCAKYGLNPNSAS